VNIIAGSARVRVQVYIVLKSEIKIQQRLNSPRFFLFIFFTNYIFMHKVFN